MLDRLKAAWRAGSEHTISLVAAGIAYYALLALVPALGATVLGYGLFVSPETVVRHIERLTDLLPPSAASLIGDQLQQISSASGASTGIGLIFALGLALFGARGAAKALLTGFGIVFESEESRGFVRGNLVALAITFAGAAGLIGLAALLAASAALPGPVAPLVGLLLLGLSATAGAMLLYRYAPPQAEPQWSAALRGALVFTGLWIAATAGFAFYAANFADYNATYGSLGAVVALLTWFWASGFALLLGAELVVQDSRAHGDS
ncbi:YihY/virulence factor BrkB family protein [Qipengyuania sp. 6B39]|uniref:YihY/virulence factor BrkB family protein n=1 Tax=Qipengyuania proteolytica TaxID=2867239 RepID=UPI001C892D25|nr:YihY/virulence factor BrkB family protein [Qipengyuania proteolytica]MBX7494603.1 YihY/virulence factor BrkB family protein [Qipengyuania proteolytica]